MTRQSNHLIHEKSPYLLQHAYNPVDWYPWGEEAFALAARLDKPIFLSIGYSTCHWCHRMEEESFSNEEVAHLLNEYFVNIKVDREERPEVDTLYMEFAQTMTVGAAGWPLNLILTPTLTPFFATTYLPPFSSEESMGMVDLIARIWDVWNGDDREKVLVQSENLVDVFRENLHVKGDSMPEQKDVESTVHLLYKMTDPVYGGLKGEPKFPIAYQSNLLLQYSHASNDSRALFIVERTMDMMQRGGIYDQLGGGFSRYSVDSHWFVPHFEKMLCDNALLTHSYLETWKLTKKEKYRDICEEIIHSVLRDMTGQEGGFYSAIDADSEGKEGLFYTWTYGEVLQILGEHQGEQFCDFFDITEEGNFEEGQNVLHRSKTMEEFAWEQKLDLAQWKKDLAQMKHRLWTVRRQRVHPLKDDKILSGWNGMMIYSLVEAGVAMGSWDTIEAAVRAMEFIRKNMWKDHRLYRRWREGECNFKGGLDEYAHVIRASLSLFEAGCGNQWLLWAMELTEILEMQFKEEDGAFYDTDGTDPHLILRKAQFSDGSEPSGNAIHCENLLRLYQITYDEHYRKQAEDIFRAVKRFIQAYSPGYCYHVLNLMRYFARFVPTIVIALNPEREFESEIRKKLYSSYFPYRAIIWLSEEEAPLFDKVPYLKDQRCLEGKTTVYICHDRVCKKPINDLKGILKNLSLQIKSK